ncbi:AMP-binding protein [Nonomuraea dietziae]|uniref:AMP-binding protein n=1 Tax=Nonomuraea dietziae TaxID=65515 RepID=UPI00361E2280
MPVAAQVLRHATERPHQLALCGPGGSLTYAQLWERVSTRRLGDKGLVAISLADPVEQLVTALAADLAGATPLLCEADQFARVTAAVPVSMHVESALPEAPDPAPSPSEGPDDLAWACLTSGSTGRPRAVVRTRHSWTGSFPYLSELAGIGPDDVVLVPGPLVSSLYGFAAVHALAAGATAIVPGRWSPGTLTVQLRRASVVHLVPHRLPGVLAVVEEVGGPLRTAVVGGAALPERSRAMAAKAGVRVVSYYGATEMSFVAVDADGSGLRPFPQVEIEVRRGEVWARSPWMAKGYLAGGGPAHDRRRGLDERGRPGRAVPPRRGAQAAWQRRRRDSDGWRDRGARGRGGGAARRAGRDRPGRHRLAASAARLGRHGGRGGLALAVGARDGRA